MLLLVFQCVWIVVVNSICRALVWWELLRYYRKWTLPRPPESCHRQVDHIVYYQPVNIGVVSTLGLSQVVY